MTGVSKYWDPAWQQPTVIFSGRHDVETLAQAVDEGAQAGFEIPEDTYKDCSRKDGLLRVATVGPDYTVQVAANDRVRAADLQRQIGRLTFYFICSRPRIVAVEEECGIDDGRLTLTFDALLDDGSPQRMSRTMDIPDGVDVGSIGYEAGGAVLLRGPRGAQVRQQAALLAQTYFAPLTETWTPSLFDLRIHYIGRARGQARQTCALDRLEAHPKYIEAMEQILHSAHRNRDVWLILASGTTMHLMTGHSNRAIDPTQLEAGDKRARRLLGENTRIDLTEALLINYFKPPLNDQHTRELYLKGRVLEKVRRAEITGLALFLATDDLRVAAFTEEIPPRLYHTKITCL
jgi:hypothetical protein